MYQEGSDAKSNTSRSLDAIFAEVAVLGGEGESFHALCRACSSVPQLYGRCGLVQEGRFSLPDHHRKLFHFSCIASDSRQIQGWLRDSFHLTCVHWRWIFFPLVAWLACCLLWLFLFSGSLLSKDKKVLIPVEKEGDPRLWTQVLRCFWRRCGGGAVRAVGSCYEYEIRHSVSGKGTGLTSAEQATACLPVLLGPDKGPEGAAASQEECEKIGNWFEIG